MNALNILIVDDDPIALTMLQSVLEKAGHQVFSARSGAAALRQLSRHPIRIVITDWVMEAMDGLQLCRAIRARRFTGYVYIIMLSARDEPVNAAEALSAGVDDFIAKPFDAGELSARIQAGRRMLSLEMRDVTIFALARLAESRDTETGLHLERVRNYVRILAEQLATLPDLAATITGDFVQLIYDTSPLHDIGKVSIPDAILLKPGKLTAPEYEIMKRHASIGAATLQEILQIYPEARFLEMARNIAATHHEKFDGSGYPAGLAGNQIPLCGHIMALADVYDAITSKRVYKDARSHEFACLEIRRESGKHFSPWLVESFFQREKDILAVHRRSLELEHSPKSVPSILPAWRPPIQTMHDLPSVPPTNPTLNPPSAFS